MLSFFGEHGGEGLTVNVWCPSRTAHFTKLSTSNKLKIKNFHLTFNFNFPNVKAVDGSLKIFSLYFVEFTME